MLRPDELAVVAGSVPSRRREFATVRACARSALAALGVEAVSILPGPGGAPRWPAGFVGSMTHCPGFAAAAVARTTDLAGLGIDAEPNEPLPVGILPDVANLGELVRWPSDAHRPVHWDRLLFSAKEAVYKAWYPWTGVWLDPLDIAVDLRPDGSFRAGLPSGAVAATQFPATALRGRWVHGARTLVTAAFIVP